MLELRDHTHLKTVLLDFSPYGLTQRKVPIYINWYIFLYYIVYYSIVCKSKCILVHLIDHAYDNMYQVFLLVVCLAFDGPAY